MKVAYRSLAALGGCLGALTLASPGHAQGGDPAAAEALFENVREAMAGEDYATACSSFEESNRLEPAPGTMVNLAGCEEKRGRLATAWQWLEEAINKLPAGDPRQQLLEQRAAGMKA